MKRKSILAVALSAILLFSFSVPVTLALETDTEGDEIVTVTPSPEVSPAAEPSLEVSPMVEPTVKPSAEPEPTEEKAGNSELYGRIMSCTTIEEIWNIIDNTPQEQLMTMSDEEIDRVGEKIDSLMPEPLPPVVISEPEENNDEPVPSEIVYVTVNFDDVAPFGAPVVG